MGCTYSKSPVLNAQLPAMISVPNPRDPDQEEKDYKFLIHEVQNYEYQELLYQFHRDKSTFILNQLLYSIQFFDSFDKASKGADEFKVEVENRMNKILRESHDVGVIGGDRKVTLMSGMGEVLARNYVYRSEETKTDAIEQMLENFKQIHRSSRRGRLAPTSFRCEGILPLDFYINYENFEVNLKEQFPDTKENDYSLTRTEPPALRSQMEIPEKANQIPQGYVRLLVDSERTRRSSVVFIGGLNNNDDNYDYTNASETYGDRISEAISSCPSSLISDEDTESMINMTDGEKLLHRRARVKDTPRRPIYLPGLTPKPDFTLDEDIQNGDGLSRFETLRNEGVMPSNYPSAFTRPSSRPQLAEINESENAPRIKVEPPPQSPRMLPRDSLTGESMDLLRPSWSPSKRPGAKFVLPPRPSRVDVKKDLDNRPNHLPDSGYDSMSASSSAMSTAMHTLPFSANIRRRALELKELWQYQRKTPLVITSGNSSELAPDALIPIKVEKDVINDSDSDDSLIGSSSSRGSIHSEEPEYRIYLSSAQFAASFFSEFHELGKKLGLKPGSVYEAQVLGASIRCCVDYVSQVNHDDLHKVVYTFTPTLHCKHWPRTYEFRLNQRVKDIHSRYFADEEEHPVELDWPSRSQLEAIYEKGCRIIPQGYQSTGFFNAKQSMEWLLSFPDAESVLLKSFQHAHWRVYICSAILLRAFVFPHGPLGVGLEHVRNIMYQLCTEELSLWEDQQCGLKLKTILQRLDESLSRPKLSNFFLSSSNMLKSTARENTLIAKNSLKAVKDNLLIHCIHSLRNLNPLQPKEKTFPFPKLKKLFELLTTDDSQFIYVLNPKLKPNGLYERSDYNNNGGQSALDNSDHLRIEKSFHQQVTNKVNIPYQRDRQRVRLKREYEKRLKQRDQRDASARTRNKPEEAKQEETPAGQKPGSMVDLTDTQVSNFSNLRLVAILDYFIKHFLRMAESGLELEAYAEASGYTLHAQNLCKLLREMKLGGTNMDDWKIQEYERSADNLRKKLGPKIYDYIRAKVATVKLPTGTSLDLFGLNLDTAPRIPSSNFQLKSRKLPTPPVEKTSLRYFQKPNFSSMQQIQLEEPPVDYDEDLANDFQPIQFDDNRRSRGDILLFVNSHNERSEQQHTQNNSKSPSIIDIPEARPGPSSAMFTY